MAGRSDKLRPACFFCAVMVTGLFEGLCKALISNPGTRFRTADTHFVCVLMLYFGGSVYLCNSFCVIWPAMSARLKHK